MPKINPYDTDSNDTTFEKRKKKTKKLDDSTGTKYPEKRRDKHFRDTIKDKNEGT